MPEEPSRSPLAVGIMWASRATTIGLEFALPAVLGIFIDRWWGTRPAATLVGAVLGFAVGMVHLMRIAREGTRGTDAPGGVVSSRGVQPCLSAALLEPT